MSKLVRVGLVLMVLCASCPVVMAEDTPSTAPAGQEQAKEETKEKTKGELGFPHAIAIVGACIGAALCAIGGGYAIANIGGKCIEAIARQPEAAGTMFAPMIVSAAMVEGGMLFAIVVCLLGVLGL